MSKPTEKVSFVADSHKQSKRDAEAAIPTDWQGLRSRVTSQSGRAETFSTDRQPADFTKDSLLRGNVV
jgi:hypothetical protein